jgi:hypothetical protein
LTQILFILKKSYRKRVNFGIIITFVVNLFIMLVVTIVYQKIEMVINRHFPSFLFIVTMFFSISGIGQNYYDGYFDGPYVFFNEDTTQVYWIEEGKLRDTSYMTSENNIDLSFILSKGIAYEQLIQPNVTLQHETVYKKVKDIVAISDIHGQYDLMIQLFTKNKVIDENGKWAFGEGHLVVVGDIFDRGEHVLDIIWFMINLEKEADAAGGKVHVLLGNHEVMVLESDIRYVHKKYRYTSALFRKPYAELFDEHSFLGQWVRSKPIYLKINDISFVHGGISEEFFQFNIPMDQLNTTYYEKIFVQSTIDTTLKDPVQEFLLYEGGPLWYRGYAVPDEYTEERTNLLLDQMDSKHIVVGHTSMPNIVSLLDNKILLIDSSIKLGQSGEILFIKNGRFISADQNGNQKKL